MSKLTLPPALQKVRRGYQKLNIPGILIGDILLILFSPLQRIASSRATT